jgi:hypothetical protein
VHDEQHGRVLGLYVYDYGGDGRAASRDGDGRQRAHGDGDVHRDDPSDHGRPDAGPGGEFHNVDGHRILGIEHRDGDVRGRLPDVHQLYVRDAQRRDVDHNDGDGRVRLHVHGAEFERGVADDSSDGQRLGASADDNVHGDDADGHSKSDDGLRGLDDLANGERSSAEHVV